jgi:hypothetical protein
MPASNIMTDPPEEVHFICDECGYRYDCPQPHSQHCKRFVRPMIGDHNRSTGFDGTYANAARVVGAKEGREGRE